MLKFNIFFILLLYFCKGLEQKHCQYFCAYDATSFWRNKRKKTKQLLPHYLGRNVVNLHTCQCVFLLVSFNRLPSLCLWVLRWLLTTIILWVPVFFLCDIYRGDTSASAILLWQNLIYELSKLTSLYNRREGSFPSFSVLVLKSPWWQRKWRIDRKTRQKLKVREEKEKEVGACEKQDVQWAFSSQLLHVTVFSSCLPSRRCPLWKVSLRYKSKKKNRGGKLALFALRLQLVLPFRCRFDHRWACVRSSRTISVRRGILDNPQLFSLHFFYALLFCIVSLHLWMCNFFFFFACQWCLVNYLIREDYWTTALQSRPSSRCCVGRGVVFCFF